MKAEILINLHELCLKIETFQILQAKWKSIKQRRKFLAKKQASNKIKTYLIQKDKKIRLHQLRSQVKLLIKTEMQRYSIEALFSVVKKIKLRRGLLLRYRSQIKLKIKTECQKFSLEQLFSILRNGKVRRSLKRLQHQKNEIKKAEEERKRKEKEEAERKARELQEKIAQEEAVRKAKIEAERIAKEEADRKAKIEAERIAKEESDRKAKIEAERIAKEESDKKAKIEAERIAKEESDKKAKNEAEKIAKEESNRKAKIETEKIAKDIIEKKKIDAERIEKEEQDCKAESVKKAKIEADRQKAKEDLDNQAKNEKNLLAKENADKIGKDEIIKREKEDQAKRTREDAEKKAKIELEKQIIDETTKKQKEITDKQLKEDTSKIQKQENLKKQDSRQKDENDIKQKEEIDKDVEKKYKETEKKQRDEIDQKTKDQRNQGECRKQSLPKVEEKLVERKLSEKKSIEEYKEESEESKKSFYDEEEDNNIKPKQERKNNEIRKSASKDENSEQSYRQQKSTQPQHQTSLNEKKQSSDIIIQEDEWEEEVKKFEPPKKEIQIKKLQTPNADDDEEKYKLRRNLTVSKNLLPFIPKDNSDLEKYITSKKQYDQLSRQSQIIGPTIDMNFTFDKLDASFLKRVKESIFINYCKDSIKKRTKWLKEIPLETLIAYQNSVLPNSLLDLTSAQEKLALSIFSLLLSYPTQNNPIPVIKKIIAPLFPTTGQTVNAELKMLRDEIYLQTIKQMTNCPDQETYLKYGLFLVALGSSVPCSQKALFPILNYLYSKMNTTKDKESPQYCLSQVAFVRLMKSFSRSRKNPPTESEIMFIVQMKQIPIEVYIHENNALQVGIEPHFDEK